MNLHAQYVSYTCTNTHTYMYICTKKNIHYRRHTEVLNNFRLLFSFLLHFFFACFVGVFFSSLHFLLLCRWLNFNKNAKTVFQNFKSEINNKQEEKKKVDKILCLLSWNRKNAQSIIGVNIENIEDKHDTILSLFFFPQILFFVEKSNNIII